MSDLNVNEIVTKHNELKTRILDACTLCYLRKKIGEGWIVEDNEVFSHDIHEIVVISYKQTEKIARKRCRGWDDYDYEQQESVLAERDYQVILDGEIIAIYGEDPVEDIKEVIAEDPSMPKWVVWEHNDPAIIGDYHGEVNQIVIFVGSKRNAFKIYERRRSGSRWAGSRSCYVSYPHELKSCDEKNYVVGYKVIKKAARGHISDEEMWEIEHGY